MRTKTIKLYSIDELDEKAQARAISDWNNHGEFFADFVIDECTSRLESLGFQGVKIYYSGFWSQGDGACFIGTLDNDGLYTFLTETKQGKLYPTLLNAIEENTIYVNIKITHTDRYCHEYSTTIEDWTEMQDNSELTGKLREEYDAWYSTFKSKDARNGSIGWYYDTCKAIYKDLQDEYKYQTADHNVIDRLREDGEVFKSNGERE